MPHWNTAGTKTARLVLALALLASAGCIGPPTAEDYPNWQLSKPGGDPSFNGWNRNKNTCADASFTTPPPTNSSGPGLKSDVEGLEMFDEYLFDDCMRRNGWTRQSY